MDHLSPGSLLQGGKYKVERLLCADDTSFVYEAQHLMMRRSVCVHEFFVPGMCVRNPQTQAVEPAPDADCRLLDRKREGFLENARSMGDAEGLQATHIHDIFEENSTAYIVLDIEPAPQTQALVHIADTHGVDGKPLRRHRTAKWWIVALLILVAAAAGYVVYALLQEKGYVGGAVPMSKAAPPGAPAPVDTSAVEYLALAKDAFAKANYSTAFRFFTAAAEGGQPETHYYLGECYLNGYGTDTSPETAISHYAKGVAAGYADAMERMGECYYYGMGVDESQRTAYDYFNRAMNAGSKEALFYVAECYENGVEENGLWYVMPDREKAQTYYAKASAEGIEKAAMAYTAINDRMVLDAEEAAAQAAAEEAAAAEAAAAAQQASPATASKKRRSRAAAIFSTIADYIDRL